MKNINLSIELKRYFYVLLGAILISVAVVTFLAPNHIAPGGSPGLAVVFNFLSGIQIGLIMLLINIPMILISIKFIDKGFALRTIFSIIISAFGVDFFREYLEFEGLVIEPILASIYGGLVVGVALGFIIKGNASAGGPAVISKLISQRTRFKEQHILIFLDAIIVVLAGIVFKNIETTLLSLITVYISLKGIDLVLSGGISYKMVHISTLKAQLISEKIVEYMNVQGAIIDGVELDLINDKKIILLLIESNRIMELKNIIEKYDNDSFIVISDASEVKGQDH